MDVSTETTTATPTQQVIADMLGTNTGVNILDSGGANGRNWQRNAGKSVTDWLNEPRVTVDDKYGDVSLNVFHHLIENLTYCKDLDVQFTAYSKAQENTYYLEDIHNWLELLGAAEEYSVNSYNSESELSQIIQYTVFTLGGESGYVALQIHQGADARGGYTAPRIFRLDEEYALISEDIQLTCTLDKSHGLSTRGGGEWLDEHSNYKQTPWSLNEKAKERGVEGIACPNDDCLGILKA